MTTLTRAEVHERLAGTKGCDGWRFMYTDTDGTIKLRRAEGYELPFDDLAALSRAFKTRLIDVGSDHATGSRETCDYGAESWIEVTIRDAKP